MNPMGWNEWSSVFRGMISYTFLAVVLAISLFIGNVSEEFPLYFLIIILAWPWLIFSINRIYLRNKDPKMAKLVVILGIIIAIISSMYVYFWSIGN